MVQGVEFEESNEFAPIPQPKLEPPTFGDAVLRSGVVSSPGDAAIILGIFALLLVAGSFYLLASSVQPPPELGADVLRSGEHVPEYVR